MLDYLYGFPAYSPDPNQYELVFRPLADWIVNEGRARNQDDEAMVREILHVSAAYEHLSEKIVDGENHGGIGRYRYLGRHNSKSLGLHHVRVRGPAFQLLYVFASGVRITAVALFGVFQLEEISLPINLDD